MIRATVIIFIVTLSSVYALQGAPIVDFNTSPFHLNVRVNTTHVCGATLITDRWLITAAHCLNRSHQASWLTVTAMSNAAATRHVEQIVWHPEYDPYVQDNDVMLLQVTEAYNFTSETMRVLPLVGQHYDFAPGTLANLTGYGPASLWPALRGVNATLISYDDCEREYYQTSLPESVLCARLDGAALEAGDGGGALLVRGRGVGIASMQLERRPAVYTKLAAPRVRSFIQQHAGV